MKHIFVEFFDDFNFTSIISKIITRKQVTSLIILSSSYSLFSLFPLFKVALKTTKQLIRRESFSSVNILSSVNLPKKKVKIHIKKTANKLNFDIAGKI